MLSCEVNERRSETSCSASCFGSGIVAVLSVGILLAALPGSLAAKGVQATMCGRSVEPSGERRRDGTRAPGQVEETFLRRVLGVVRVAGDSQAGGIYRVRMPSNEIRERTGIPMVGIEP